MKKYHLIALVLVLSQCRMQPKKAADYSKKAVDYCYTDGRNILLFSKESHKEDTLPVTGADPDLSPDGTRVAYTRYEDKEIRRVVVRDIGSGKETLIDSGCNNCYGPVWSPDGNRIVYNAFIDYKWRIQLRDLEKGGEPVILSKGLNNKDEAFSPVWSGDGKKIIVQDMKDVLILDPRGKVLERHAIDSLEKDAMGSSRLRFLLSRDEGSFIFDMDVNDSTALDGPPSALFVYDRKAMKGRKVSPDGYDAFQPALMGDRIFFSGIKKSDIHHRGEGGSSNEPDPVFNIYSVRADGSDFKLEFKNRRDFSHRRD